MNSPLNHFPEDRPEFKGFNSFYFEEIYPTLLSRETDRKIQVKKAINTAIGIAVFGFIIAALVFSRTGSMPALVIISILGIGGAAVACFSILERLRGETKQMLMGHISHFVGWSYREKLVVEPDLSIWRTNGLMPRYDRSSFEDQMSGDAHGADFTFCEAHLEREDRDSDGDTKWVTVFRGVLMEVDFHRNFLGRTVVLRDVGIFNRKKKNGMKRVGLVDPKFEKIFEAYGTDQVEARYLLTPTFMQRLVDLETQFSGKKSRFGFLGGKLYIAVEAPNQFEAGSMFKPLIDPARTQKILREVGAIYDVIDGVLKPLEKRHNTRS